MFQLSDMVKEFQSPRSGKFESNNMARGMRDEFGKASFNPLDRGNLNQIMVNLSGTVVSI